MRAYAELIKVLALMTHTTPTMMSCARELVGLRMENATGMWSADADLLFQATDFESKSQSHSACG